MAAGGAYGFAGAVGADDEGERLEEGDDVLVLRVEAPDPLHQHLVHRAHLAAPAPKNLSPLSSLASVPLDSPPAAVSRVDASAGVLQ